MRFLGALNCGIFSTINASFKFVAVTALGLFLVVPAANAIQVDVDYSSPNPFFNEDGGDKNIPANYLFLGGALVVDITATDIKATMPGATSYFDFGDNSPGAFHGYSVHYLSGGIPTGLTFSTDAVGFDVSRVSYGVDTVYLNLIDLVRDGNGRISQFNISPSAAAVPGPVVGAGIPGLVMAFGGFLAWRRRKPKQT